MKGVVSNGRNTNNNKQFSPFNNLAHTLETRTVDEQNTTCERKSVRFSTFHSFNPGRDFLAHFLNYELLHDAINSHTFVTIFMSPSACLNWRTAERILMKIRCAVDYTEAYNFCP
jgi:hypothetical protein